MTEPNDSPAPEDGFDSAEELRELSGALAAHLLRTQRRGRRNLHPQAAAATPPPPVESAAPEVPPEAAPQAKSAAPRETSASVQTSAPNSESVTNSGVIPANPEGADERIKRLAAGCGDLESLRAQVAGCEACDLCKTRKQTVFSDGSGHARVMFVGEAPGFHEDQRGLPFVGEAGQLLTDIITKGMKLARGDVYIANILKCRPPKNRDPAPLEKALCTGWLERQIELVDPEVLIPLGGHASAHLLRRDQTMGRMRAQVHVVAGRKIVPTYHPAYLLRSPSHKKDCWNDILLALAELGLPG